MAVKTLQGQTAEVADAGESNVDELVQEVPHARSAQGDFHADNIALANLKIGDGFASLGLDRLLAGDAAQGVFRSLQILSLFQTQAQADIDGNLLNGGNGVGVLDIDGPERFCRGDV